MELKKGDIADSAVSILVVCYQTVHNPTVLQECKVRLVSCFFFFLNQDAYITHNAT